MSTSITLESINRLLVIACLEILVLSCSSIHKCNSNDYRMKEFEQIYELQIRNFAEIPPELLSHIEEMGIDSSSILNEYEGSYFNFIFKIDSQGFNLVGKKVGFLRSKTDYFRDTRECFYHKSTTIGGSNLYIFDTNQKEESGGYDAAIVYWSKRLIPIEDIVKKLKDRQ